MPIVGLTAYVRVFNTSESRSKEQFLRNLLCTYKCIRIIATADQLDNNPEERNLCEVLMQDYVEVIQADMSWKAYPVACLLWLVCLLFGRTAVPNYQAYDTH